MGNEKVTIVALIVAALAVLALPIAYNMGRKAHTVTIDVPPELARIAQNVQSAQARSEAVAASATLTIHAKGPWQSDNMFTKPKAGASFYAIDVEITNGADTSCNVNPFAFTLRDSENREYRHGMNSPEPSLAARALATGQSARGWLCYELPAGVTPTVLVFTPGLGGNAVETVL